ncbi:MAG: hypothetical protein PHS82_03185 [Lachnospiraceae bacterium]|nr:hypothetical protein [Lachnospiraceae bacterium]
MLEMKVTIEAPALVEAINNLAISLKAEKPIITNATSQTAPVAAPTAPVTAPTPTAPQTQQTAPIQQQTPPVTPQQPTIPQNPVVPQPTQIPTEKQITLEELAKAAASLVEKNQMPQIMALIQKYGVPSINQLTPDQYPPFAAELKALGADI